MTAGLTGAVARRTRSRQRTEAPGRNGLPPAIIIGGHWGSAISVARSLGQGGVRVYLLADQAAPDRYCRYVTRLSVREEPGRQEAWANFLLGPRAARLHGAVLLACSDMGLEIILQHREALAERFLLDLSNPEAQGRLLNKLSTYRLAAEAGVPTPRFWEVATVDEVRAHRDEYSYPLLVKPLYSHKFAAILHAKFLVAEDYEHLEAAFRLVEQHGLEVILLEKIPGPDSQLCSYYTYIDERGEPLFHFTKRVIRRFPKNQGLACYHVTDWIPEVRDLAVRLFAHAGLRGIGNVEFKRDERDDRLKVIECNARFTAANGLVAASGLDLARLVYERVVGRALSSSPPLPAPLSPPASSLTAGASSSVEQDSIRYRRGLHLLYPGLDFQAFLELKAAGEITSAQWVASLMHRQVFPYFRWRDPGPSMAVGLHSSRRLARKAVRRMSQSSRAGR